MKVKLLLTLIHGYNYYWAQLLLARYIETQVGKTSNLECPGVYALKRWGVNSSVKQFGFLSTLAH